MWEGETSESLVWFKLGGLEFFIIIFVLLCFVVNSVFFCAIFYNLFVWGGGSGFLLLLWVLFNYILIKLPFYLPCLNLFIYLVISIYLFIYNPSIYTFIYLPNFRTRNSFPYDTFTLTLSTSFSPSHHS